MMAMTSRLFSEYLLIRPGTQMASGHSLSAVVIGMALRTPYFLASYEQVEATWRGPGVPIIRGLPRYSG